MSSGLDVAGAVALLDSWYDPDAAEDWDAVGLVCGDPQAPVRKVLFAVDPVQRVVDEAVEWGADLLVVHHPLLLRPVHGVAATGPKGRVVHALVRSGVALLVAHTNADAPSGGVSEAMAHAFGLKDLQPLQPAPAPRLDKVVTFVPSASADLLVDALASAGAGRLGDYERCAFTSTGTGTFRPLSGAQPSVGSVGRIEEVDETRVEMVLDRRRRQAVIAALRKAHPYEEPAFDLLEMAVLPGVAGSGRIGNLAKAVPLAEFAGAVAEALPVSSGVVRVAGDPERLIRRVALCGGAGDFLLDTVRKSNPDVYVTSDLRHHPASEFLEHAHADRSGPALIDVPHSVAEALWLPLVEHRLQAAALELGTTVETQVSTVVTDPWTSHLDLRSMDRRSLR